MTGPVVRRDNQGSASSSRPALVGFTFMRRRSLRRGLLASLTALLVIPVVLVMTLGTASLLTAVGDTMAASACRWVAMALGIVWAASIVATVVLAALVSLTDGRPRQVRRRAGGRSTGRLDDQPRA